MRSSAGPITVAGTTVTTFDWPRSVRTPCASVLPSEESNPPRISKSATSSASALSSVPAASIEAAGPIPSARDIMKPATKIAKAPTAITPPHAARRHVRWRRTRAANAAGADTGTAPPPARTHVSGGVRRFRYRVRHSLHEGGDEDDREPRCRDDQRAREHPVGQTEANDGCLAEERDGREGSDVDGDGSHQRAAARGRVPAHSLVRLGWLDSSRGRRLSLAWPCQDRVCVQPVRPPRRFRLAQALDEGRHCGLGCGVQLLSHQLLVDAGMLQRDRALTCTIQRAHQPYHGARVQRVGRRQPAPRVHRRAPVAVRARPLGESFEDAREVLRERRSLRCDPPLEGAGVLEKEPVEEWPGVERGRRLVVTAGNRGAKFGDVGRHELRVQAKLGGPEQHLRRVES